MCMWSFFFVFKLCPPATGENFFLSESVAVDVVNWMTEEDEVMIVEIELIEVIDVVIKLQTFSKDQQEDPEQVRPPRHRPTPNQQSELLLGQRWLEFGVIVLTTCERRRLQTQGDDEQQHPDHNGVSNDSAGHQCGCK